MEVLPLLSTLLLIVTVTSVGLGIVSYTAYAMRARRRPHRTAPAAGAILFFHPYRPEAET
jgi:hypothetical protein